MGNLERGITIEIEDPDNEDEMMEVTLRTSFELCPTCEGSGVSCGGLVFTQSDFDEDPDLRQNLAEGLYDRPCHECNGLRVIEVVDEDQPYYEQYLRQEQARADYEAERRSEMRYCYGRDYY